MARTATATKLGEVEDRARRAALREARFVRNADRRTRGLLRQIRLLGNCASRKDYAYTEEQVAHIFDTVTHHLDEARAKFVGGHGERIEDQFKLE